MQINWVSFYPRKAAAWRYVIVLFCPSFVGFQKNIFKARASGRIVSEFGPSQELDPYLFNYSGHDAINHLFEDWMPSPNFVLSLASWCDELMDLG